VSLSEREREILAAIERNLLRESPALVSSLRAFRIGRSNRHDFPARGLMARGAALPAAPRPAATWTLWRVGGVALAAAFLAASITLLPVGSGLGRPDLVGVGLLGLAMVPVLLGASMAGSPWRASRPSPG
jgi:hypothetical protein